jgi:hypothetical protein
MGADLNTIQDMLVICSILEFVELFRKVSPGLACKIWDAQIPALTVLVMT